MKNRWVKNPNERQSKFAEVRLGLKHSNSPQKWHLSERVMRDGTAATPANKKLN
jgi:hypothetical protein